MNEQKVNALLAYHNKELRKLREIQNNTRSQTVRESTEKYIQREKEKINKLHKEKREYLLSKKKER
ncbi:hypothetical protein [Enterococcus sp. AZ196]|uniref:hypothetical protein n=1 Tax=Enterococcus sp. AZ196 TaxID=2774659 RepID=UPI003D268600